MARRKTIEQPVIPAPAQPRACVIGAGIGGLALAIRLQAGGQPTVLVEAKPQPGGLIRTWQQDGLVFEEGPAAISDPALLRELWSMTGEDMADAVKLLPVAPAWRCSWPDGAVVDLPADPAQLARLAPEDVPGYEDFIAWCAATRVDGWQRLAEQPQGRMRAMLDMLGPVFRHQGWRSAAGLAASLVKSDKLRAALSFQTLLSGGNPRATSAFNLLGQIPEGLGPAWWPEGGMGRLIAAMTARFEKLGGELRLHDPVVRIHTVGNRVTEIECASGWRSKVTLAASNADVVHTYRDLMRDTQRGPNMARKMMDKSFSPSAFTVHYAQEGIWTGIPQRLHLFGPRFNGLLDDIFSHGVLPQDMMILLSHPTVTDPGLAPTGRSVFAATVPVANLVKLPIDWDAIGPVLQRRVLNEIGRRLVPDIEDRVITAFHTTPRDLALDFNAWAGAGWSLEPSPIQSGPLRPHHRDSKLANLYLVGAGTHPGAGLAAVLAGAKATARLMVEIKQ